MYHNSDNAKNRSLVLEGGGGVMSFNQIWLGSFQQNNESNIQMQHCHKFLTMQKINVYFKEGVSEL